MRVDQSKEIPSRAFGRFLIAFGIANREWSIAHAKYLVMLKVSVITACRQAASTIADAVASVASQDYPYLEHIVVDGASTDGTLERANSVPNRISIAISEADSGMYEAMNKGLARASGDIVGILNADDTLASPVTLSRIVACLETFSVDSCYGDLELVAPYNPEKVLRRWKSAPYDHAALLRGWAPPHPTFYVRRSVYERYGNFNPQFSIAADMDLMFRFLAVHKISTHYLDHVLVRMRSGGASNGKLKNILRANWQTYRSLRSHGIPVSPLYPIYKLWRKVLQLQFLQPAKIK